MVGHIWRYKFDRFGWTSRSSQLYERRLLLIGAPLFHYGTLLAILGHATGLLLPKSWTNALGVPESLYSAFSKAAGTTAAVLIVIGLAVLPCAAWAATECGPSPRPWTGSRSPCSGS